MKESKWNTNKKAGVMYTLVMVGMITGIMITSTSIDESGVIDKIVEIEERAWKDISHGNEANMENSTFESGILSIYYPLHQADPETAYLENNSDDLEEMCLGNGTGYTKLDDYRIELPHSTAFDIVVRVRANKTVCWNGTAFIDAYARVNTTSEGFGMLLLNMTPVPSRNDTGQEYIWINFYVNNNHNGFVIARGNETLLPSHLYQGYY